MIVFDLDDTLYPEHQYARSGYLAVGKWLHERQQIDGFAELAWQAFETGDRSRIFNTVFAELGVELCPELLSLMIEEYRSHRPSITLFDDATRTLDILGDRSELGLLTDGFLISQRLKVESLGIKDRFSLIVFTDELGEDREHWKPATTAYLRFMERMADHGLTGPLVYIGDNPNKDFVAARHLGWHTIRVRRPGLLHSQFDPEPGFEADVELQSLESVVSHLAKLLSS